MAADKVRKRISFDERHVTKKLYRRPQKRQITGLSSKAYGEIVWSWHRVFSFSDSLQFVDFLDYQSCQIWDDIRLRTVNEITQNVT